MTEHNTEAIEADNEAIEEEAPKEEPPEVPTKSRKVRSELQLKALAAARQRAYIVRAEKAAIKKQNESKKTPEVSIEFQKSYQDVSKDDPAEIPDESKDVLPENENENIRDDVKKENEKQDVKQESQERQQFTDHINSIIDTRIRYKPIVKTKFKMIDGVYVIRE